MSSENPDSRSSPGTPKHWADQLYEDGAIVSGDLERARKYPDRESWRIGSDLEMIEGIIQEELPAGRETAVSALESLEEALEKLAAQKKSVSVPDLDERLRAIRKALGVELTKGH